MTQNSIGDTPPPRPENDNSPPVNPGPIINLPPLTLRLMISLVVIHAALAFSGYLAWAWDTFGFIPARFTGDLPFQAITLLSPLTYAALHGSWYHLGVNLLMLMAFGAGCERLLGPRMMMSGFILATLTAAALHFALNPTSPHGMIGASGGISGLFGLMMVFMQRQPGSRSSGGLRPLLPLIGIWVFVSLISGLVGSPDGSAIAWIAHIGGFLGGIGFGLFLIRQR